MKLPIVKLMANLAGRNTNYVNNNQIFNTVGIPIKNAIKKNRAASPLKSNTNFTVSPLQLTQLN